MPSDGMPEENSEVSSVHSDVEGYTYGYCDSEPGHRQFKSFIHLKRKKAEIPKTTYSPEVIERQFKQISELCPLAFPPAYEVNSNPPTFGVMYDYISYAEDWMERLHSCLQDSSSSNWLQSTCIAVNSAEYHALRQQIRLFKHQMTFVLNQLDAVHKKSETYSVLLHNEQEFNKKLAKSTEHLGKELNKTSEELDQQILSYSASNEKQSRMKSVISEMMEENLNLKNKNTTILEESVMLKRNIERLEGTNAALELERIALQEKIGEQGKILAALKIDAERLRAPPAIYSVPLPRKLHGDDHQRSNSSLRSPVNEHSESAQNDTNNASASEVACAEHEAAICNAERKLKNSEVTIPIDEIQHAVSLNKGMARQYRSETVCNGLKAKSAELEGIGVPVNKSMSGGDGNLKVYTSAHQSKTKTKLGTDPHLSQEVSRTVEQVDGSLYQVLLDSELWEEVGRLKECEKIFKIALTNLELLRKKCQDNLGKSSSDNEINSIETERAENVDTRARLQAATGKETKNSQLESEVCQLRDINAKLVERLAGLEIGEQWRPATNEIPSRQQ